MINSDNMPTDAALREAVDALSRADYTNYTDEPVLMSDYVDTLLRAVQAPRLTGEQEGIVRMLHSMADAHDVYRDEPGEALRTEVERVFPDLFGEEG